MSDEKTEATKTEVHRFLEAKFIEPVDYPTWFANVVMVKKKNGKWRMCISIRAHHTSQPRPTSTLLLYVATSHGTVSADGISLEHLEDNSRF
jgi:hypothetical protein